MSSDVEYCCCYVFLSKRGNLSTQRKTPRSRVENQQTKSTCEVQSGNRTRDTLVGGERSHHCANLAPCPVTEVLLNDDKMYYMALPIERNPDLMDIMLVVLLLCLIFPKHEAVCQLDWKPLCDYS